MFSGSGLYGMCSGGQKYETPCTLYLLGLLESEMNYSLAILDHTQQAQKKPLKDMILDIRKKYFEICQPKEITTGNMMSVAKKYLARQSVTTRQTEVAINLIYASWREEWPCE